MREDSLLAEQIERAEAMLAEGLDEEAVMLLASCAADAEDFVANNAPTTEKVQYFAFPSIFDRLLYRRVEDDPRELRDIGEPLDQLYSDLAYALVRRGDYERASEALRRAIRWNPMDCAARLDLAELYLLNGDVREWIGLTYSVFDRASDVRHLARAFANFARYFDQTGQTRLEAAALRAAQHLDWPDELLARELDIAAGTEADPAQLSDEEAETLLAEQGLPFGANAEVAICLLMCASDAAAAGEANLATELTIRARDLVGPAAAKTLMALINESNSEESEDA